MTTDGRDGLPLTAGRREQLDRLLGVLAEDPAAPTAITDRGEAARFHLADSLAAVRMREMGIRAALGASPRQLGSVVLAETARLVGVGLAVGK